MFRLALAVATCLFLSGCGGGGSSSAEESIAKSNETNATAAPPDYSAGNAYIQSATNSEYAEFVSIIKADERLIRFDLARSGVSCSSTNYDQIDLMLESDSASAFASISSKIAQAKLSYKYRKEDWKLLLDNMASAMTTEAVSLVPDCGSSTPYSTMKSSSISKITNSILSMAAYTETLF